MQDDWLAETLQHADERFQRGKDSARGGTNTASFVDSVRRRRAQQVRRRQGLGVLAVLLMTVGVSAWSLNADIWKGGEEYTDAIASAAATHLNGAPQSAAATEPTQDGRLREEEIAQLKAEIAALDAEANRARRFVELYQAAEARRERLAAAELAVDEPLLPTDVLAQLQIDRAAAITVISADSQANEFNRPEEAAESYRSVLKHFPGSRWASVARERLAQIQHMN